MRDEAAAATAALPLIAASAEPLSISQPVASHSNDNQAATAAATGVRADCGGGDRRAEGGLRQTRRHCGGSVASRLDAESESDRRVAIRTLVSSRGSCADQSAQLPPPHPPRRVPQLLHSNRSESD